MMAATLEQQSDPLPPEQAPPPSSAQATRKGMFRKAFQYLACACRERPIHRRRGGEATREQEHVDTEHYSDDDDVIQVTPREVTDEAGEDTTHHLLELKMGATPSSLVVVDDDPAKVFKVLHPHMECLVLRNMTVNKQESEKLAQLLSAHAITSGSTTWNALQIEDVQGDGSMALAVAVAPRLHSLHLKAAIDQQQPHGVLSFCPFSIRTLLQQPHLVELRLCHNRLTMESIQLLSRGLRYNSILRILDLLGNALNDQGIFYLAHALTETRQDDDKDSQFQEEYSATVEIHHCGTPGLSCGANATAATTVTTQRPKSNQTLEFLCLDFNDFGNAGMDALGNMLEHNHGLQELHLFGNHITPHGGQRLAISLEHNSTLESLVLSFNDMGDVGAAALAEALTKNRILRKLWIPSNRIGNDGVYAFAQHLPHMKGLQQLNFGGDVLCDPAAVEAFLKGLERNHSLTLLYLESPICAMTHTPLEDKLDYYLRLNRSGRRYLHGHHENDDENDANEDEDGSASTSSSHLPMGLWANLLANSARPLSATASPSGAPDVLYHLLLHKPELLEVHRR